jgi:D-alanyl-D-alanine carboxypeptidase
MMTLLLTFKALQQKKVSMSTLICISKNAASQQPCSLGLKAGDKISLGDAIMTLITKSANDISVAIAEHLGKDEKTFIALMNKEAKRLDLKSTLFLNPSGWTNHRQLTTVKDMAKLARALLSEYPCYYHLFATRQFCFRNKCFKNHNNLLGKNGDIVVDGIKTGFVNASGFNLAASARRGKDRLIAVVLGGKTGKQRDALVKLLFQKCFKKLVDERRMSRYPVQIALAGRNTKGLEKSSIKNNEKPESPMTSGIYYRIYNHSDEKMGRCGQHKIN